MKGKLFQILILLALCHQSRAQQVFQLASPLIKYNSVFFKKRMQVDLKFAQLGTTIHYTTDGTEPTAGSKLFKKPIRLRKQTTLKAKVFGVGFRPSETTEATFIKDGLPVRSITASTPDEKYRGSGPRTLFDNEGGIAATDAKSWLGYRQDSVVFNVMLDKPRPVRSVLLHFLQDKGGWIFLPQHIQVLYRDAEHGDPKKSSAQVFKKFGEVDSSTIKSTGISAIVPQTVFGTISILTSELRIMVTPLAAIPAGHPGSGQKGWLFIDEIKVY